MTFICLSGTLGFMAIEHIRTKNKDLFKKTLIILSNFRLNQIRVKVCYVTRINGGGYNFKLSVLRILA